MVHSRFKTKHGKIVIRDCSEKDFTDLVGIYRGAFSKHNIFQKSHDEIIKYLKKKKLESKKAGGRFIVARLGKKCVGAVLVHLEETDVGQTHTRWKFRHVAVMEGYQRAGIGTKLIEAADNIVYEYLKNKHLKTAKIEVTISDNEKATIPFYRKNGFEEEGELKHHYRFNEITYVLGKLIK